ncbi:MAG: hypothetical protein J0L97_11180, partial [Alphaproteobacteria bacterium]|nr:hypothetical protein [Alphaproteobacteria bacterium]
YAALFVETSFLLRTDVEKARRDHGMPTYNAQTGYNLMLDLRGLWTFLSDMALLIPTELPRESFTRDEDGGTVTWEWTHTVQGTRDNEVFKGFLRYRETLESAKAVVPDSREKQLDALGDAIQALIRQSEALTLLYARLEREDALFSKDDNQRHYRDQ